jgi:hypothetical protein
MDVKIAGYSMFSGTNPPGCVGCIVTDTTFNQDLTIQAAADNDPGTWVTTTSEVPEPSSIALLSTGAIGAFCSLRRRLLN